MDPTKDLLIGLCDRQILILNRIEHLESNTRASSAHAPLSDSQTPVIDLQAQVRPASEVFKLDFVGSPKQGACFSRRNSGLQVTCRMPLAPNIDWGLSCGLRGWHIDL